VRNAGLGVAPGDRVARTLLEPGGEGHFGFLDPAHPAFEALYGALDGRRTSR
jgi:hypothetical protein